MTDMTWIVYLREDWEKPPQDLYLVRDDYPGKHDKKRFFACFESAKEFTSYDEAFKEVTRGANEGAIETILNKCLFIDIHPRYRYG